MKLWPGFCANGGNVYDETIYYNYSPVWMNIVGLLDRLPLRLIVSIRLFLSLVDAANAYLIYRIAHHLDGARPLRVMAYYWLNPAVIFIVAHGGQFETLALLPIMIWLYFYFSRGWQQSS